MRLSPLLPLLLLLACAQPQPTPAGDPKSDVQNGAPNGAQASIQTGVDCTHAVVIQAKTETEGTAAEYQWLKAHRPGAVVMSQRLFSCGDRIVDILAIRAKDGQESDVYFDTSSFFGKY